MPWQGEHGNRPAGRRRRTRQTVTVACDAHPLVPQRGNRPMSTISVRNLTKRYGPVLATDDLSFDVQPGKVTGFLGPNGSGKTTTLRILLGLAAPTSGTATIDGRAYRQLPDPVRRVGVALDSNTFHPGRSAAQHLRVIATATGLPHRRVDEVLGLVGLSDAAGRSVGGFSLGMRQRLSLAEQAAAAEGRRHRDQDHQPRKLAAARAAPRPG